MRFFLCTVLVVCIALTAARSADATPTRSVVLRADKVDYYSNRFILTADGNVRARLSDGTVVSGNTFSMDLKLNRFVLAGNVHVDGPKVHLRGAALAMYPDLDRTYFLPEGQEPDRWTFFGLDWSDNHAGRDQPGDAFFFPDLSNDHPYVVGNSVTIFPKNNIEFPPGSLLRIAGAYVPTPGWVVNFSSNPDFYQNAFAGAVFDIAIPFTGSETSISAFHIRYSQPNDVYISFDQHFVWNRGYAVFSVNPLTQDSRQWNLIVYNKFSPAFEARTFTQLFTTSTWPLAEPVGSSAYTNFQTRQRIGNYATTLNIDQYNNTLLAVPSDYVWGGTGLNYAGHPMDLEFSVQSFENEIRPFRYLGVPVKFQYRAGWGYDHDSYGIVPVNNAVDPVTLLPVWGGVTYTTIYNTFVGATVYTSPVKVTKYASLSVKYDDQRQTYSLGHHVDTGNFTATISHTPSVTKEPAAYLSYNVLQIGDYYGADQLIAYPPAADTVTNQYGTFSGLAAFRGFATQRTLTGSVVYSPTPYFTINVTGQHYDTTPAPIPGLGGNAPNVVSIDVRVRVLPTLLIDASRAYYFNWASESWAPAFGLTLSP